MERPTDRGARRCWLPARRSSGLAAAAAAAAAAAGGDGRGGAAGRQAWAPKAGDGTRSPVEKSAGDSPPEIRIFQ